MKSKYLIPIFLFFSVWFIYNGMPEKTHKERRLNRTDSIGSINFYTNSGVDVSFATSKSNYANGFVNLEKIVLERIKESKVSIDAALYELNLPNITNALIESAARGVRVRVIVDSKKPTNHHYIYRYQIFRLHIEKLLRGKDNIIGTEDDVHIFSDGPMYAVDDSLIRSTFFHDSIAIHDILYKEIRVGKEVVNNRVLCLGEYNNKREKFYSGREQMHNKYLVFDDKIVWTGSWNLTLTGLYGGYKDMKEGKLNGNVQHSIEIYHKGVAQEFTNNFNVMWGSSTAIPNYKEAKFHSRKHYRSSTHYVGGDKVELIFPPGDEFLSRVDELITQDFDVSLYFAIFAWSHQGILNSIKDKCDKENGLDLKGVFDDSFWNVWWSASYDMRGEVGKESKNNPSVPWDNRPDIVADKLAVKMHAKTMIIDSETNSDPTVITGSSNWSENAAKKNDENVVIIHSKSIANQFIQSFFYSYNVANRLK